MISSLLGLTVLIQLLAAGLSFYFMKHTHVPRAWLLAGIALILMAVRQSLHIYQYHISVAFTPIHLTEEAMAFFISLFALIGIAIMGRELFKSEAAYKNLLFKEFSIKKVSN